MQKVLFRFVKQAVSIARKLTDAALMQISDPAGNGSGQRPSSESVNSSIKQRYGSELTATTWYGEFRELVIKYIVHNLRRAAS